MSKKAIDPRLKVKGIKGISQNILKDLDDNTVDIMIDNLNGDVYGEYEFYDLSEANSTKSKQTLALFHIENAVKKLNEIINNIIKGDFEKDESSMKDYHKAVVKPIRFIASSSPYLLYEAGRRSGANYGKAKEKQFKNFQKKVAGSKIKYGPKKIFGIEQKFESIGNIIRPYIQKIKQVIDKRKINYLYILKEEYMIQLVENGQFLKPYNLFMLLFPTEELLRQLKFDNVGTYKDYIAKLKLANLDSIPREAESYETIQMGKGGEVQTSTTDSALRDDLPILKAKGLNQKLYHKGITTKAQTQKQKEKEEMIREYNEDKEEYVEAKKELEDEILDSIAQGNQAVFVEERKALRKQLKDLKEGKPIAPWAEKPKEYMEHYIGRKPNFTVGKLTEKDKKSLKEFRDEQRQWRKNIKEGLKKKLKQLVYTGNAPKKGDKLLTKSEIKALEPK